MRLPTHDVRDDSPPLLTQGCLVSSHGPLECSQEHGVHKEAREQAKRTPAKCGGKTQDGADQPDSLPQRGPSLPTKSLSAAHRGAVRAPSQPSGPHERSVIQGPFRPRGYSGAPSTDGTHQHQGGWGLKWLRTELRIREEEISLCFPGGLQSISESGITVQRI